MRMMNQNRFLLRKVTVRSLNVDCSESGYCKDLAAHLNITVEVGVSAFNVAAVMVREDSWILLPSLIEPLVIVYPLTFSTGLPSSSFHNTETALDTSPILQKNV